MATRAKVGSALHRFYSAFLRSGAGRILGLATEQGDLRDGVTVSHLARIFPWPEFKGITIEPVRRRIREGTNTIAVGWSSLFYDPEVRPRSGASLARTDDERLKQRLRRMVQGSALRITGSGKRRVVEDVWGKVYTPTPRGDKGDRVDYAVIRRQFFSVNENVVVLEGVGLEGTMGAGKVGTDENFLGAILAALDELERFEEDRQVEILVATEIREGSDAPCTMDDIEARPLLIVYDGRWVYDLDPDGTHTWVDRSPWDVEVGATETHPAAHLNADVIDQRQLLLEIRADLRAQEPKLRKLCRKVLGAATERSRALPAYGENAARWVDALSAASDEFEFLVHREADGGVPGCYREPKGVKLTARRHKRFLLHLALQRLWNRTFAGTPEAIRRLLPEYQPGASGRTLRAKFVRDIPGKMRKSFPELLGPAGEDRNLVSIEPRDGGYGLRLARAGLVLRLRI